MEDNISVRELMAIDANGLRQKQYQAFKAHVVGILDRVARLIDGDGDLKQIQDMVCFSPAGDGYGSDNHFINFGFPSAEDEDWNRIDILEACARLLSLRTGKPHAVDYSGEIREVKPREEA